MSENNDSAAAQRHAMVLVVLSSLGTVATVVVWFLCGWFWAVCGLVAVCIILTTVLFGFAGPTSAATTLSQWRRTARQKH